LGALGIISIFSLFIFTEEGRIICGGLVERREEGLDSFTSRVNVTIFLHDYAFGSSSNVFDLSWFIV
jgi:hypothetical protein